MMEQSLVIITNLPDAQTAQSMARLLVERKLAACVNILPGVQSVYRWQGAVEEAMEVTLLIKSVRSRYADVESAIRHAHPYDLPEVIALPIAEGSSAYLGWIAAVSCKDREA